MVFDIILYTLVHLTFKLSLLSNDFRNMNEVLKSLSKIYETSIIKFKRIVNLKRLLR